MRDFLPDTKENLTALFLMVAGAYSFIMGFKNSNEIMYILGIVLFAGAYMVRIKCPNKQKKKSKR